MKRILLSFCLILALLACLCACGNKETPETSTEASSPEGSSADTPPAGEDSSKAPDSSQEPDVTDTDATTPPVTPADANYKNTKWDGKTLKILAIGNSFSVDAMTYLYRIAEAEGVEEIILGNLYIGGCTLETHAGNVTQNKPAYEYFKASSKTKGEFVKRNNTTLLAGLIDEDWDIITMQQASGSSGITTTYTKPLATLVNYVNEHKTNPEAQLAWHMTWAYQQDSTHGEFSKYQKKQNVMYNAILLCVNREVLSTEKFSLLIPSGTAVQNARTSYFGDRLTRDGYHLNELARYLAGYTWFTTLTGQKLTQLKYQPAALSLSEEDAAVVLEAVNASFDKPLGITPSAHTEKPSFDLSGYTEFKYDYIVGAYWNSGDGSRPTGLFTTANNSKYYIATELFTKETLPVGTVIVLDEGWQYRPERWKNAGQQSGRPEPVTTEYFTVTEEFWNGYAYRAFNLSVTGAGKDITKDTDAVSHMRFYAPNGMTVPDKTVTFDTPTAPAFDPADYDLLNIVWTLAGYWNSTDGGNHHTIITGANNSGYFAATQMFTRETLPVGSVIVVDEGWQYRPEAWKDEKAQPGSSRPGNTSQSLFVVTEEWWGDYVSRAFNLSRTDGASIKNDETATTHFRVYIPKK